MPEVRKTLYERGYIVIMGGAITGFSQANGTDLHCYLTEVAIAYSKLTIETLKQKKGWNMFKVNGVVNGVFIVNFEHISQFVSIL